MSVTGHVDIISTDTDDYWHTTESQLLNTMANIIIHRAAPTSTRGTVRTLITELESLIEMTNLRNQGKPYSHLEARLRFEIYPERPPHLDEV